MVSGKFSSISKQCTVSRDSIHTRQKLKNTRRRSRKIKKKQHNLHISQRNTFPHKNPQIDYSNKSQIFTIHRIHSLSLSPALSLLPISTFFGNFFRSVFASCWWSIRHTLGVGLCIDGNCHRI